MPLLRRHFMALPTLALADTTAIAQPVEVKATQPWARATAASARSGAAYLILVAGAADAVVGASSPIAATAELHRTVNEEGIIKILPAPNLELPGGTPVELKPGGLHIMLVGLTSPLKQGMSFPITLRFRTAAPVTISVKVEGPGASGPGHSH